MLSRYERMRKSRVRVWAVVAAVLVVALGARAGWPEPSSPDAVAAVKALPSLSSSLAQYYLAWKDHAPVELQAEGMPAGPRVDGDGAVLVWVQQAPGTTTDTIDVAALERLGARVAGHSKHFLEAWIPPAVLPQVVGQVPGVTYLREPPQVELETVPDGAAATGATVSEGVALTGATAFHEAGFRGAGVKVAVIDLGYAGLSAAIASGEVPSNCIQVNLTSSAMESDGPHGTACAEVVYDMAPDAQLYIVKTRMSQSGFELAAEYCLAQGVQIINCSWGLTGVNFFDGQGDLCALVNDLAANGVLPVFVVGSRADGHNEGVITDSNGDGQHEFAAGVQACSFTAKQGALVEPVLTWDDWPVTSQDLDLYVYDSTGLNLVASSTGRQRGTQPPVESVMFAAPYTGTYYVVIRLYDATPGQRYELFVRHNNGALQYVVRESSVICPADATGALAVGAIHYQSYTTGPQESDSCQGPTNDGRLKPELCGPDGVTTSSYGMPFLGTSAAAPHVAGAAALLMSAHPEWSMAQVRQELLAETVDMGAAGPDNVYGNGRLSLTLAEVVKITTLSATPATVASGGTTQLAAEATDSQGHPLSWSWSDGGAGGSFSSATAQNPAYAAPANTSGADRVVTLTVTATGGTASDTATVTVTVQTEAPHTLSLNAYPTPATVPSGGTTSLTAAVSDSLGHDIASWSWSDGGAGGGFSSATVQNPAYTAPANTSGSNRTVTLTVTATCNGASPLTKSASTTLTVQSTTSGHTVTVTASANPTTVASGGAATVTMSAVDSKGHTGLAYSWSDNGAGGTFASPTARNTTYTAPTNTTEQPRTVTLTATAVCKWQYPWVTGSTNLTLTVNGTGPAHTVTVSAAASPSTVASGGATTLTASGTDDQGHGVTTWAWSDGGAGGAFSPSAAAQNPTYTAAANTSGANRVVTLRATGTCSGSPSASGTTTTALTVLPEVPTHALTVSASASPSSVASGGTTACSATATDSLGHGVAAWSWSDGGAGGTFSSTTVQNPTYTAPANTGSTARSITLSVTATCNGASPLSATGTRTISVQPVPPHTLSVTATVSPGSVPSGGTASLSATATDSLGHAMAWSWSDGGAGGAFSSTTIKNPTYRAPTTTANRTVTLTVTATCNGATSISASRSVSLKVRAAKQSDASDSNGRTRGHKHRHRRHLPHRENANHGEA